MASSSEFYVSTSDNRVRPTTEPSREYFMEDGLKAGKAKYIIEVFGYSHQQTANELRDILHSSGFDKKIFNITVEMR